MYVTNQGSPSEFSVQGFYRGSATWACSTHRTDLSYSDSSLPDTPWYSVTQSIQHTKQTFTTSHMVGMKYPVWSNPWVYTNTLIREDTPRVHRWFPRKWIKGSFQRPQNKQNVKAQVNLVNLFCTASSHCFGHLIQLNYPYYLSSIFSLSWPSTQFSALPSYLRTFPFFPTPIITLSPFYVSPYLNLL